jgi:azurin
MESIGEAVPNPYRTKLPDTVKLEIAAGKNLTFSTRELRIKRGVNVEMQFNNPDVVPHNWVLIAPGKLADIGDLTNKMIADPAAYARHYVPKSEAVIAYTDIVPAGRNFSIYFSAPKTPGRYPYLCTFPGHWMAMNGELIVE